MKKRRCIILIDGSNFYFKLKDLKLHRLLEFDFSGFVRRLVRENKVVETVYYIGAVRTDGSEKTQKLFKSQRRLLNYLGKNKIRYSLGYLLKSGGKFHEKGVDVNIAVDILVATYENLCDEIILVSSDTDLLPAVKKAKKKGKKVEYIGFSHQPSVAMVANCSSSRLLTRDDLLPFVSGGKGTGKKK
ncbi:NYN domain-containing protein [Candidatus Curtissbacteria bacterium]|nr:NYN domain-containing protein [Candidatus Curtissbacteria bacterium]